MYIAVEGCGHGELDGIYAAVRHVEKARGITVDLLIICGDFQSTRNPDDLKCMAVPPKYYTMGTFYKYYGGELKAPVLTLVVGGNHEASNFLQSLAYGGWLAPNIYYVGYASVLKFGSLRLGALSGIYKGGDYMKGHYERPPYDQSSMRSAYHVRNAEAFRLKQLTPELDVFVSHDWPRGVYHHGDVQQLLRKKPFFKEEVESNKLGSRPAEELLRRLRPRFWFAAHLHVKFSAVVRHSVDSAPAGGPQGAVPEKQGEAPVSAAETRSEDAEGAGSEDSVTRFLALDKCLPRRRYMQILELGEGEPALQYDLEWLTVLRLTDHLTSVSAQAQYMPGPGSEERYDFRPTAAELAETTAVWGEDLRVPTNFAPTVAPYDGSSDIRAGRQPAAATDPQTNRFCRRLGIRDPMQLLCGDTPPASTRQAERPAPDECDITFDSGDVTLDPDGGRGDVTGEITLDDDCPGSDDGDDVDDMFVIDRRGSNAGRSPALAYQPRAPSLPSSLTSTPVKPPDPGLEEPGFTSRESVTPNQPDAAAPGSAPAKKFKRRNQAIYGAESED